MPVGIRSCSSEQLAGNEDQVYKVNYDETSILLLSSQQDIHLIKPILLVVQ